MTDRLVCAGCSRAEGDGLVGNDDFRTETLGEFGLRGVGVIPRERYQSNTVIDEYMFLN